MPRGYGMSPGARRQAGRIDARGRAAARRREANISDERVNAVTAWLDHQVNDLHNEGFNGFYADVLSKSRRWGLTPGQVEAVERAMTREAEFAARRADETRDMEASGTGPVAEGRRTIQGEVVSVKEKDTAYGPSIKMLVRESDGNKVWGTVPQTLIVAARDASGLEGWESTDLADARAFLTGKVVSLVATVTRSDNDPHFGFYSRPAEARVVETYPGEAEDADDMQHGEVCERGHRYDVRDGFCETCAEGDMEAEADRIVAIRENGYRVETDEEPTDWRERNHA